MSLIIIKNYHREAFSLTPEEGDYAAYFENQYGEQLIYHQKQGEKTGTLYHGDNAWHAAAVMNGQCPALVLDRDEEAWLRAVWSASNTGREFKKSS